MRLELNVTRISHLHLARRESFAAVCQLLVDSLLLLLLSLACKRQQGDLKVRPAVKLGRSMANA
jgi:hypothetical protein